MTVGSWYYVAMTYGVTNLDGNVYHAAVGDASTTEEPSQCVDGTVIDACTLYFGPESVGGNNFLNGSVAAVKIWTARLSKAEIDAERATYTAVRTANLWAAYGFAAGPQTSDDSGNGRLLTVAGTPVLDASGPPITSGGGGTSYALAATGNGTTGGSARVGGGNTLAAAGISVFLGGLVLAVAAGLSATGTGATVGRLTMGGGTVVATVGATSVGTITVIESTGTITAIDSTGTIRTVEVR